VDGVSWRILLEDLEFAYRQARRGEAIELPAKTTSFRRWAQRLQEYAGSAELAAELSYWLAASGRRSRPLPLDFRAGANTAASARTVAVALDREATTQITDVLLTALARSLSRWAGDGVQVDLEGHGREEIFAGIDLSRTVGWFTTVFPLPLAWGDAANPGEVLMRVKEQLRAIPNRGLGFGVLRHLVGEPEICQQVVAVPRSEVIFNYQSQFDQVFPVGSLFLPARAPLGPTASSRSHRPYLLEVNVHVAEECLQMGWTYSKNIHRGETMERLAQTFVEALGELLDHCQSREAGGHTPSDFPLAGLDEQALDRLTDFLEGEL
jgi:non-ribosomal peptide synthase protein (TIGR01720 family)